MNPSTRTGRCLCGSVRYSAMLPESVGACHCGMCRRWSSGPMLAIHAHGTVEFEGEDAIARYASSDWAERGFCAHCGTNLFYRLLPREGVPEGQWILSAGTLDDASGLSFDLEIYVDQALGWLEFTPSDQRKRLTEAEVLAMYAPPES